MKLLIEIEGPGADRPVPGEPEAITQIEAFTRKLMQERVRSALPVVTVHRIDDDMTIVKIEALLGLQKRSSLLFDIVGGSPDSIEDDHRTMRAISEALALLRKQKARAVK